MNILFHSPEKSAPWHQALQHHLPDANVFVSGEDKIDHTIIEYALVWRPPPGLLASLPNLKGIFNLGAGVDMLIQDATLPHHVPLVRLVDPVLTSGMVEYVVHWVLHFHRDMHIYATQQRARKWRGHNTVNADTQNRRIGILGLGELGQSCAHALLMLGFESITGWSRTAKHLPGVTCHAGQDGLQTFLNQTDILVCLLPLTHETRGLINADTLAALPQGAFIINAGRGPLVKDDDLIAALEKGHIQAAALDVFNTEPLPEHHAYWGMDTVFITPHIASLTTPMSASAVAAQALRDLENGQTPYNVVNVERGY